LPDFCPGRNKAGSGASAKAEAHYNQAAGGYDRAKARLHRKSAGAPAAKCRNRPEDFQVRRELNVFHDQLDQEEDLRDRLSDECPSGRD